MNYPKMNVSLCDHNGKIILIAKVPVVAKLLHVKNGRIYEALRKKSKVAGRYIKHEPEFDSKEQQMKWEQLLKTFSTAVNIRGNSFKPVEPFSENELDYATKPFIVKIKDLSIDEKLLL